MLLGLTGGIAAGKSTALAAFAAQGCPTLSSDEVVHALYRTPAVRDAVVRLAGSGAIGDDGQVDRARLGAVAFEDPSLLDALEQLVHPLVAEQTERFRARWPDELAVHEVPLLFEAGVRDRYDRVVLITAPDELRRARAPERFARRSARQMPEQRKRELADDVYVNDGTRAELEAWVAALVRRLREGA